MGGHVNSCPEGHYHQIAYNSCLHRCCPQCAWMPREEWLLGWRQRLLNVPHHHIVFTIPHQLNQVWRYNKAEFANTLFAAASQALSQLLDAPAYLGAKPGILAALHTWNQKLDIHVHLHVLVTAGGLSEDGQWLSAQKGCLLPRKVLMAKFRGKLRQCCVRDLKKAPSDCQAACLARSSTRCSTRSMALGMSRFTMPIETAKALQLTWHAISKAGRWATLA